MTKFQTPTTETSELRLPKIKQLMLIGLCQLIFARMDLRVLVLTLRATEMLNRPSKPGAPISQSYNTLRFVR